MLGKTKLTEKERAYKVCQAHEEIIRDPDWLKLMEETDKQIKELEEKRNREYRKIRNKYWRKYGI